MNIEEFDYVLPESLIAQTPLKQRDQSRLLYLNRDTGETEDLHFKDITRFFQPGDTLVLNDTRVMPKTFVWDKRRNERQSRNVNADTN